MELIVVIFSAKIRFFRIRRLGGYTVTRLCCWGFDGVVAASLFAAGVLDEAFFPELSDGAVDGGEGDSEVVRDVCAFAVRVGFDEG